METPYELSDDGLSTRISRRSRIEWEKPVKLSPVHPHPGIPDLSDMAIDPSRLRLKRVATTWEKDETAPSPLARMTLLHHGGYNLPIVTRGKRHLRVRMASRKTGRRQMMEGASEYFLGMDSETRWDVRDWEAHPFVLDIVYDGRAMSYHLDLMRQLRDGTIECIEAKRTERDMADPEYALKLACVAEVCRRVGWQFHIRYKADILGSMTRRRNVEMLFGQIYKQVDDRMERTALRFESAGLPIAWGSLRDALVPTCRIEGNAVIHHLSTRQRLAFDLDAKVTADTIVTPLPAAPAVPSMRV